MIAEGFPEERVAAAREQAELSERFDVYEENWKPLQFFISLSTQWRRDAMGQISGLDYMGTRSAMDMRGVPRYKRRGLFAAVQIMEVAALAYFNEKQN